MVMDHIEDIRVAYVRMIYTNYVSSVELGILANSIDPNEKAA